MADFLDILVMDALESVRNGYYKIAGDNAFPKVSLKESITKCQSAPVIAEIKPSSPSYGKLRQVTNLADVAKAMESGGAVGISVLTEPRHFDGSLVGLVDVKRNVRLAVLMKDIIVNPLQVEAAARLGADTVLLIYSVFERGYVKNSMKELIQLAHSNGLEVLLEVHTREQLLNAIKTEADLVGINNRDLRTLQVDLNTTKRILSNVDVNDRIIVSESGIQRVDDIRTLRSCGAKAFLVGSAIMLAGNVEKKVRELVMAYENS
jgi:indole-3-glycerol phosphate synthase